MEDGLHGEKMVFVIAEIGINHNGDINTAKKLIDIASDAGCDAVKFQKRTIEKVYSSEILDSPRESPWGKTTRDQKNGLELSLKQFLLLISIAKRKKFLGMFHVGILKVKLA